MHFLQKANFSCVIKIKRPQKLWQANSMIKNIVVNFSSNSAAPFIYISRNSRAFLFLLTGLIKRAQYMICVVDRQQIQWLGMTNIKYFLFTCFSYLRPNQARTSTYSVTTRLLQGETVQKTCIMMSTSIAAHNHFAR